jgi:hypothetical protein
MNSEADILANVASKLCPSDDFSHDIFFVELIYRSSIPDNITNWRVLEDGEQILNFLHSEDTFKGSIMVMNSMNLFSKLQLQRKSLNTVIQCLKTLSGWRNCLIFRISSEDRPTQRKASHHYYMKL